MSNESRQEGDEVGMEMNGTDVTNGTNGDEKMETPVSPPKENKPNRLKNIISKKAIPTAPTRKVPVPLGKVPPEVKKVKLEKTKVKTEQTGTGKFSGRKVIPVKTEKSPKEQKSVKTLKVKTEVVRDVSSPGIESEHLVDACPNMTKAKLLNWIYSGVITPHVGGKRGRGIKRKFSRNQAVGLAIGCELQNSTRGANIEYVKEVISAFENLTDKELDQHVSRGNHYFTGYISNNLPVMGARKLADTCGWLDIKDIINKINERIS